MKYKIFRNITLSALQKNFVFEYLNLLCIFEYDIMRQSQRFSEEFISVEQNLRTLFIFALEKTNGRAKVEVKLFFFQNLQYCKRNLSFFLNLQYCKRNNFFFLIQNFTIQSSNVLSEKMKNIAIFIAI